MNHMEIVHSKDKSKVRYYIPHSCVIKPDSTSTKLRVVFDASAKTSSNISLNDIQHSGPVIQRELFDLLLDFRCHDKVATADVVKMYRQVNLHEEDSWFQCILWRNDPSEEIQVYRLKTVTYGEAASSFLACRALHEVGEEIRPEQPEIAEVIQQCFYVDNFMMGGDSAEKLLERRQAVESALMKRGFPLRKWASNDVSILAGVSDEDLEKEIRIGDHDIIKTLGVAWSPKADTFRCIANDPVNSHEKMTKRQLASEILRLYDPLGIMQPIIITAKILLQGLWKIKLKWDDEIPADSQHEWQQLKKTLPKLASLTIPRQAIPSNPVHLELHGFSDASNLAYGCAVYAYCIDEKNRISMNLLCAKSRVAPMKDVTLPRKELLGAKLLAELMKRVISIIPTHVQRTYYWCDSQVVLAWIHSSVPHSEVYVRNRINVIQSLTHREDWRYVPTDQNPADIVSRGISVRKLLTTKKDIWLHATNYALENRRRAEAYGAPQVIAICSSTDRDSASSEVEDLISSYPHHNSFQKTRRHFAVVNRAMNNFMSKSAAIKSRGINREPCFGPLTVSELEAGEQLIVKHLQRISYPKELAHLEEQGTPTKQGPLQHLSPIIEDGLIRIVGRLSLSDLPQHQRRPAIIPQEHFFGKIILEHIHRRNLHAGLETIISDFQQRYWMRNLRKLAKTVVNRCILCARARPRKLQQQMGQLPRPRVNPSPAFTHTGVDLCGPFQILPSPRAKTRMTVYVCIFVCFSTKAVHLEVVEDQSTGAFIAALMRFTSLRGKPEVIYSDNGRNFVGAGRELAELRKIYNNEIFQDELVGIAANKGINFSFIPPRSPNFGGLWEANIKVAKRLFTAAARGACFNILELQTVLYQVAAIMNSRPLTVVWTDASIPEPLTPGHFLIGRSMTALPIPGKFIENGSISVRWKRIQHQTLQFWRRWQDEYLQHLRCMAKWTKKQPNLAVGQVVLIGDDHNPVAKWPMGIVTSTHPGADGVVRVATVRVGPNLYKRNVRLLAPLPIDLPAVDNNAELSPINEVAEHEEDPPPRAIWDDRLRPRPKGGRKWM
ncbi:uncharacterized protein LOC115268100 [Aedes albopictus]|uniref:Integrase catalytic domain-containing protein n=1 Tax=Aedes albopictus TaxID=7160 RepID=A0ABM1ZDJ5_AEDAL